ncbi:MAG TPA: HAD domain-containing protein, partial [Terriglobales bacterium]|nr:HAD domain-containing protein [Terriglobales bacterium]
AGRVVSKTPAGKERGEEIAAWLAAHEVAGYVVLDDHVVTGDVRSHLVLTHSARGLQPDDVARALTMLTRPCNGGSS